MSNPAEDLDQLLSEAYDSVVTEEVKEEVPQEIETEEVEEQEIESVEEQPEVETEDESTEEVEDEVEIDEEEPSFAESLKGKFSKENIELLESIEDTDLRSKLVEEGIKQRSDLDRKRQELGESKKLSETLDTLVKTNNLPYNRQQYNSLIENYINLDAMLAKDPMGAIKILAENAKLDLSKLVSVPQTDDQDDYRLPEEIERDSKIKALEDREQQRENLLKQQEQVSAQKEINDFVSAVDANGNLKYPHFQKVGQDMLNLSKIYVNDSLEDSYQRAILLNPELSAQRDIDTLKKAELGRKAKIEKAKKLKRQSVRSSKVNARIVNHDAALESAFDSLYG